MSYPQYGVFAPAPQAQPPAATGYAPQAPQVMPQQAPQGGYGLEALPPMPGAQPGTYGAYGAQGAPGIPGAPQAQPLHTMQPGQQWGGVPQGTQPQAPPAQPTPQWPQAPQAMRPQAAVMLDDNSRIDGPSVPPELRGRTWGEARRLYSALSTDWLQRNPQQAPRAPQPQGTQPQGTQPQGTQPPAQPQTPAGFWQNPDQRIAEVVGQVIEQRLAPALQPVLQRTQQQAILEARGIAATGVRDFAYLEPEIMQIVSRAAPQDLMNPEVWTSAADMARGKRIAAGSYAPQQPAAPPQPRMMPSGPGVSTPAQPLHSFFSESPSAPSLPGSYGTSGPAAPTQDDYFYAQKFQMPIQDYMAWKYGAQPAAPAWGAF